MQIEFVEEKETKNTIRIVVEARSAEVMPA